MEHDEHLVQGGLLLPPGSILCVEDGREIVVHVRDGDVWITQECDLSDVMLKAGERFRIARRGRTLIQALRGSVIVLTSPYERYCARRIELVHPRAAGRPLPVYRAEGGRRGAIAALTTSLMKTWCGLYARPTGRAGLSV